MTYDWNFVFEDDIYLVSYPRSGNTWLRNILTNLRFPDAQWNLQSMGVAFPEVYSNVDPLSVPRPRWIKSHSVYTPRYKKVIYLIRDVRDVAVSYYHWSNSYEFQTFGEFVNERIVGGGKSSNDFGSWHGHVSGWLDHAGGQILYVKYEDILNDPLVVLQSVCQFLGISRTNDEILTAIKKSSLEKQQKDFSGYAPLKGKRVGVSGGASKFRDYFTDEVHETLWDVAGEVMMRAGYAKSR